MGEAVSEEKYSNRMAALLVQGPDHPSAAVKTSAVKVVVGDEGLATARFDEQLAVVVRLTLERLLGHSGARSVIYHTHLINHMGEAERIHLGLRSVLGAGSTCVEKAIVDELYAKLGIPPSREEFDFSKEIEFALSTCQGRDGDAFRMTLN